MIKVLLIVTVCLTSTDVNRDPIVQDPIEQPPPSLCRDCVIVKWATES